ncbi:restriction endonuclease subunit S [Vibrio artabrorum]|uniref:restriction endonuclease subunit S n=1 Tax=Vibrio artabrorum TaxID=446374 RepID=UPI0035519432
MSDWYETRLGDIADICIGGTPSRAEPSYWVSTGEEGFPWVSISDLKGRIVSNTAESITSLGARNSNVKLVPCGTIMMSFKLSLGRIAFAGRDIYTNEAIASFEVDTDKIDKTFLFYQLPEVVKLAITDTAIKGATLNKAKINELVIPHPELVVQRKIAEILSTIDNQIDATQALIDKYTAIKQGMMADLFSRGIDPETKALRPTFEEAPELYYKTPLGILPKGWDIAPFEQLSEVIDPNPSHRYPDSVSIDGVPIASTENFEGTDGFNLVKSKLVPDSEFEKQFERCKYQKDDVIFARKGRIGFARQYGDAKKVFSHTVVVMKAKAGVSPDFLLWLARSTQYLEAIDFKMNSNSGVPTLGVDVIKRVRVAVPSVEEQQDIAKCLNQINKKIHTELAFLAKTKAQKSGLMQDLLTGKVPVAA